MRQTDIQKYYSKKKKLKKIGIFFVKIRKLKILTWKRTESI